MNSKLITLIVIAASSLLIGCSSYTLPNIAGDSITYSRTDPLGGTQIEATGVRVTDKEVVAETASWNTTYPAFTAKLTVKGYRRQRTQEDPAPSPAAGSEPAPTPDK